MSLMQNVPNVPQKRYSPSVLTIHCVVQFLQSDTRFYEIPYYYLVLVLHTISFSISVKTGLKNVDQTQQAIDTQSIFNPHNNFDLALNGAGLGMRRRRSARCASGRARRSPCAPRSGSRGTATGPATP